MSFVSLAFRSLKPLAPDFCAKDLWMEQVRSSFCSRPMQNGASFHLRYKQILTPVCEEPRIHFRLSWSTLRGKFTFGLVGCRMSLRGSSLVWDLPKLVVGRPAAGALQNLQHVYAISHHRNPDNNKVDPYFSTPTPKPSTNNLPRTVATRARTRRRGRRRKKRKTNVEPWLANPFSSHRSRRCKTPTLGTLLQVRAPTRRRSLSSLASNPKFHCAKKLDEPALHRVKATRERFSACSPEAGTNPESCRGMVSRWCPGSKVRLWWINYLPPRPYILVISLLYSLMEAGLAISGSVLQPTLCHHCLFVFGVHIYT